MVFTLDLLGFVGIQPLHAKVAHHQLGIFSYLHIINLEMDWHISQITALAAAKGQDSVASQAHALAGFKGFYHIGGIATAGKHNQ
jgi:hypothetical protein